MQDIAIGLVHTVSRKLRQGYSSGECETFAGVARAPGFSRPLPVYLKFFNPTSEQRA